MTRANLYFLGLVVSSLRVRLDLIYFMWVIELVIYVFGVFIGIIGGTERCRGHDFGLLRSFRSFRRIR